jgi:3-methyladenine DNA glycosylase AlkD
MKEEIVREFSRLSSKEKARICGRFFKTGEGEYGEGDVFLGIPVPLIRGLTRKYYNKLDLKDLDFFLKNEIHEYRFFALTVLVEKYKKGSENERESIYHYYLRNTKYVNNWDLVDISSYKIVGNRLKEREDRRVIYDLAKSESLWDQRIAIVSTFSFIKENDHKDILKLAEILIGHEHDLIHKALGWMLREVGKRDMSVLREFLDKHHKRMPRTMLRYAIEKMGQRERVKYLKKI